ncbi:MAG: TPM domain-containing protein [Candidatus Stygibacter frigidus]|nr:TPM domain-containing protein [Candidatus Stygibacter frigidus]
MLKLSKAEQDKIAQAVKQAELKTSGEIATALIPQSNDYAIYELLLAVIVGLIYSVVIFSLSSELESWLQRLLWNYHVYYLTGFYLFSTFLVILIVYFLANIPVIDRLIVPRKSMQSWVERRAMQHFAQSGVGHTKDGTGILIFISALERRVQLLADYGIAQKVDQSRWQQIVDKVTLGIKSGSLADKLSEAILECGELLEKDFPRASDDINELNDNIVQLDK